MATESLTFKSGLDDSKFQAGLNRMEKGAQAVTGKISGMMKGIGVTGVAKAVFGAAKDVANVTGELSDQAAQINMNVESMQRLQGVLAQSGVGGDKFIMAMQKIGMAMTTAREEGGPMLAKFEALGISFEQIAAAGDDVEKVFYQMSDALKESNGELSIHNAALEIVGAKGGKMVGAMSAGTEQIKKEGEAISILTAKQVEYGDRVADVGEQKIKNLKIMAVEQGLMLSSASGVGGGMKDKVEPKTYAPFQGPNPDDVKKRLEAEKEALEIRKESLEVVIKTAEEAYNAAKDATVAAKEALKTVLSGDKLVKISSKDRNVKKMMDQMENPAPIDVGLKSGKLGPGLDALSSVKSSLKSGGIGAPTNFKDALKMRGPFKKPDAETRAAGKDDPKALSSRSGAAKAIKALEKTKELEKEKKDELDNKRDQEKRMVKALELIQTGINGK